MGPALRVRPPYGTRGVRARLRAVGQAPRAGLVLEEVGVRLSPGKNFTHFFQQFGLGQVSSKILRNLGAL